MPQVVACPHCQETVAEELLKDASKNLRIRPKLLATCPSCFALSYLELSDSGLKLRLLTEKEIELLPPPARVLAYPSGEVPTQACPQCRSKLDGVTATNSADPIAPGGPEPGSLSVCLYCASVLVFDEERQLQVATRKQIDELPDEVRTHLQDLVFKIGVRVKVRSTYV